MWMHIIRTDDRRLIEARAHTGTIEYRTRIFERFGPQSCLHRVHLSTPSLELADHLPALITSRSRSAQPMAFTALRSAIQRLAERGAPATTLDLWRTLLEQSSSQARPFHAAFMALRDLLSLADQRVRTRKRKKATDAPPVQLGQDDPQLSDLMQRILRVVTGPEWGEGETQRYAETPVPKYNDFIRATLLARWRRAKIAELPLEDLDALLADRQYLTQPDDGQIALDLAQLLALRERIEALAPWSDLSVQPTADVDVASLDHGGHRWTLTRNERRWGVRVDAAESTQLAAGIGAELARRLARANPFDRTLAEDLRAHARAAETIFDPRDPFVVAIVGKREISAHWWRGAWRFRARGIRWSESSTGDWEWTQRRTGWRRDIQSLLPQFIITGDLPHYLHPVAAPAMRQALELSECEHAPTCQAWEALVVRAENGEIVWHPETQSPIGDSSDV